MLESKGPAAPSAVPFDTPMVLARQVRKSFGVVPVLNGVDLTAKRGEVLCLVGPSGSGKSTFLRCINHLEKIDGGGLFVDGKLVGYRREGTRLYELSDREAAAQRAAIGMVFQKFNLFGHKTVIQNLIEAPIHVKRDSAKEAIDRAQALLDRVGMLHRADAYPSQLSGGQQQRVAIARALAMRPKLMLFDEPTSALDPELVGEVLDVMKDLAKDGMTMIVVTHEMSFARDVAHGIVFMDAGVVAERMTPSEFFSQTSNERIRTFLSKVR